MNVHFLKSFFQYSVAIFLSTCHAILSEFLSSGTTHPSGSIPLINLAQVTHAQERQSPLQIPTVAIDAIELLDPSRGERPRPAGGRAELRALIPPLGPQGKGRFERLLAPSIYSRWRGSNFFNLRFCPVEYCKMYLYSLRFQTAHILREILYTLAILAQH